MTAFDAEDYERAFELTAQAAELGIADAQNRLGYMYYDGEGVEQDYAKDAEWFALAAEQGFAGAQNNLGCMYYEGEP